MKTIRILTIGNSFAENALTYLEDMARNAEDVRFQIGRANLGGCTLEKHWNLARHTRRHPEYKTYRIGLPPDHVPGEGSLQAALAAAPWDYVTFQQASVLSWRPETFQPYLACLHRLAQELAPQAKPLLHQTWAYRSDSPFLPQHGLTQETMFARIRAAYALYASELACGILPAGEAVQLARRATDRFFSWPDPCFDYQNANAAPSLPRQDHSLSEGWKWAIEKTPDGIPELRLDSSHLNTHGRYLVGCVWWERLTGRDARALGFCPVEMDRDTAVFLRSTAHEVCAANFVDPIPFSPTATAKA